jgi:hypothetical protein
VETFVFAVDAYLRWRAALLYRCTALPLHVGLVFSGGSYDLVLLYSLVRVDGFSVSFLHLLRWKTRTASALSETLSCGGERTDGILVSVWDVV